MSLSGDLVTGQPVSFRRWRQLLENTALQEGVVGAGDFKVAQRAAGATMSVDIATGQAFIAVDTGALNGLSGASSDAVENRAVTASNATNPRVDQVILRYNDTAIPTGSGNTPTLEVLAGTATAGATLDTRTGAAALPIDAIRLADVLVAAASTTVTTANIRDRRPWARGVYNRILRVGTDYTTAGTGFSTMDATNLAPRIECSGVPVRITLRGISFHSVANGLGLLALFQDGAAMDAQNVNGNHQVIGAPTGGTALPLVRTWDTVPAAGSHIFAPSFATVTAGTLTVVASAGGPVNYTIEELVRQNAANT